VLYVLLAQLVASGVAFPISSNTLLLLTAATAGHQGQGGIDCGCIHWPETCVMHCNCQLQNSFYFDSCNCRTSKARLR
jgi:hypothetical protein